MVYLLKKSTPQKCLQSHSLPFWMHPSQTKWEIKALFPFQLDIEKNNSNKGLNAHTQNTY